MLLAACFSVAFAVRAAERPLCFHASMPTNADDFGDLMRRGAAAMREQWRSGLERRKASRIESQRRREGNDDSYPPAFGSAARSVGAPTPVRSWQSNPVARQPPQGHARPSPQELRRLSA